MRQISVRNLQRRVPVDAANLEAFANDALRECLKLHASKATELTKLREISVLLVSGRRMAQLHRQFLHQPGPTDVLTFEHGEVFICVPTAKRNARRFGNSLTRELRLYIVHGLLHLHGFDDQTGREARKMQQVQEKILAQLS